jgi:DNA-binding Lrp family transcriptional regulator
MPDKLDLVDLRMIESLEIYGPRNLANLARKLDMPAETLRKRLKRLRPKIFLYANIYHTNLGLKKALVLAQSIPGHEELLYDCMKAHDFWIYLSRCYGMNEGCLGIYTIPKNNVTNFEQFVHQLVKFNVAKNVQIFWSTCFQGVHSRSNWFDPKENGWTFPWGKWIEEIPTRGTELPNTLIDPKDFPLLADETDILIVKELEKNPAVSLTLLAKGLDISQQLAEYHYRKHILARGMIESFAVLDFRFDLRHSDMFYFIFRFDSMEKFARFTSSLMDKPFVGGLGKVLGENALIAHIYLPRLEFRNFIDVLSKLIEADLLKSYTYVIQDLRKAKRQTIPYEHFKNGSWKYDQNKHIQNLMELAEHKKSIVVNTPECFSS